MDLNICIDRIFYHNFYFSAKDRIEDLNHANEAATEHAEGDSKEDNANVSLTDIDIFRSKMGKQVFARWTSSFMMTASRF